jgi:hypothetical protein
LIFGNTTTTTTSTVIKFDETGRVLLSASWGAGLATVPTLRLYDIATQREAWSMSTPGSMFSADVVHRHGSTFRVTAAGKAVHANVRGDGGDAYVIDVTI